MPVITERVDRGRESLTSVLVSASMTLYNQITSHFKVDFLDDASTLGHERDVIWKVLRCLTTNCEWFTGTNFF
ncbi:hypothetical protein GDO81_026406 [Engystomops pustulosus]|uniref:Uncharacterized protein n=1 Tax=Engystomops pustulosus TaxID=76066 RepID=A0AAV6ZF98_ENGPU|nr:hypothetical protein GDO81_026406 [Engystomops pustulosus]